MCPPEDGAVDKRPKSGYSIDKEGAASRSAPPRTRLRDNRYFGRGRLSLLVIVGLENQGNDSSNDHAELKNSFPCNHAITPSLSIGGKRRLLPPKKSGEPPAGVLAAPSTAYHKMRQIASRIRINAGKSPYSSGKVCCKGFFVFISAAGSP